MSGNRYENLVHWRLEALPPLPDPLTGDALVACQLVVGDDRLTGTRTAAELAADLRALAAFRSVRRTLSGDLALAATDPPYEFLDPGGADRTVTLPSSGTFLLKHVGGANSLAVRQPGGGLLGTLTPGDVYAWAFDGTAWQGVV